MLKTLSFTISVVLLLSLLSIAYADSGGYWRSRTYSNNNVPPYNTVKKAQIMLTKLGYDTKGIDGIIGPNTISAIIDFQKKVEIDVTGELDQQTQNYLFKERNALRAD